MSTKVTSKLTSKLVSPLGGGKSTGHASHACVEDQIKKYKPDLHLEIIADERVL